MKTPKGKTLTHEFKLTSSPDVILPTGENQIQNRSIPAKKTKVLISDKTTFLTKHGWIERPLKHVWRWNKPPLPALYQLDDAYNLERSNKKSLTRQTS